MHNHQKGKEKSRSQRQTNAAKRDKEDENDININVIGARSSTITVVKRDEEQHGKSYNVYKITVRSKSKHNIHGTDKKSLEKDSNRPKVTPWVKTSNLKGDKHSLPNKRVQLPGKKVVFNDSDSSSSDELFFPLKRNYKTFAFRNSTALDKSPKKHEYSLSKTSSNSSVSELSVELPKRNELIKPKPKKKVTFVTTDDTVRNKKQNGLPEKKARQIEPANALPEPNTQFRQSLDTTDSVNNLSDITYWQDSIPDSLFDEDEVSRRSSNSSLPEFSDSLPGQNTFDNVSTLAYMQHHDIPGHADVEPDQSSMDIIPRLHTSIKTDVCAQISPKKRDIYTQIKPTSLTHDIPGHADLEPDQSSMYIIPRLHTSIKTDVCAQISPKKRDTFTQVQPASLSEDHSDMEPDQSSMNIIPRLHTKIITDVCAQMSPKKRDTFTQVQPTSLSEDHAGMEPDQSSMDIIPRLHKKIITDVCAQISPKKRDTFTQVQPASLSEDHADMEPDQSSMDIIPRLHTKIITDVCAQISPKKRDIFTQIQPTSFTTGKKGSLPSYETVNCTNPVTRWKATQTDDGSTRALQDYIERNPSEEYFDSHFPLLGENPSEVISITEYSNIKSNKLVDQSSDLKSLSNRRSFNGSEAYFDKNFKYLKEIPNKNKPVEKLNYNSIQGSISDNISENSSYFDTNLNYFVDQRTLYSSGKTRSSTPSSYCYFDKSLSFPNQNTRKLADGNGRSPSLSESERTEESYNTLSNLLNENVDNMSEEQHLDGFSKQTSFVSSKRSKKSAGKNKPTLENPTEDSDETEVTRLKRSANISLSRSNRSNQSSFEDHVLEHNVNPEYQKYIDTRFENDASHWVFVVDKIESKNPFRQSYTDDDANAPDGPEDKNTMTDGSYDELNNQDDMWFGTIKSQTVENYEESAEEISEGTPNGSQIHSPVRRSETKPIQAPEIVSLPRVSEIHNPETVSVPRVSEIHNPETVSVPRVSEINHPEAVLVPRVREPTTSDENVPVKKKKKPKTQNYPKFQVIGTALLSRKPIVIDEPKDGHEGDPTCSLKIKGSRINGLCNLYFDPRMTELLLDQLGFVGRKIKKLRSQKQSEELKSVYLEEPESLIPLKGDHLSGE